MIMKNEINHMPLKPDEIIQSLSKIDIVNKIIGSNYKKMGSN